MKRLDGAQAIAARDRMEEDLARATEHAVKRFLSRMTTAARTALRDPEARLAASAAVAENSGGRPPSDLSIPPTNEWMTLGKAAGWWSDASDEVVDAVSRVWQQAYEEQGVEYGRQAGSSLDPSADYITKVKDRLVRGIEPPIFEGAFDLVRRETSWAVSQGLSTSQLSTNIAKTLGWDPNRSWAERQYNQVHEQITGLLDLIGPPGDPARERFKASDPRIRSLQERMAQMRLEMDRAESVWKTRATRIARTETTGAYNFAAINALATEGVENKKWMATEDARTRPSHAAADGQSVSLDEAFTVGGVPMQMPCDPSAPAKEVVNCRCVVVGDWDKEDERLGVEPSSKPLSPPTTNPSSMKGMPEPIPPIKPPELTTGVSEIPPLSDLDDWVQAYVNQAAKEGADPANLFQLKADMVDLLGFHKTWAKMEKELQVSLKMGLWGLTDGLVQDLKARVMRYNMSRPSAADILKKYAAEMAAYQTKVRKWAADNGFDALTGMGGGHDFTDGDGIKWATKNLGRFTPGDEADQAWNWYSYHGDRVINGELRTIGQTTSRVKKSVAAMDKSFTPSPEAIYVRRGTEAAELEVPGRTAAQRFDTWTAADVQKLIGTVQQIPGYTSTSIGSKPAFWGTSVRMTYKVPKGSPIVDVMQSSHFNTSEREIALPRDSLIYIHNITPRAHGGWNVEAEVLPAGRPKEFYEALGLKPQPK